MTKKINLDKILTDKRYIVLLCTLCTFLWGSAYPAIKLGYNFFYIQSKDSFSKLLFAGYRFFLAGIILMLIQKAMGKSIMPKAMSDFKNLTLLGIVHTLLQYVFLYIGMANTTGVKSSILGYVGVFVSIILAHFIYKNDKLSLKKIIGFLGIIIINFQGKNFNLDFNLTGDGFVILSTVMGSIGSIYNKELVKKNDVFVATIWQLILGSLMLIIIGKFSGGTLIFTSAKCGILLLYMALLSSVSLVVWSALYKYNKVGKIAIYSFLIPVFGALLSAVLLGDSIWDIKSLVALALACIGIWIVNRE
ncbi:DMT family transporter [Clostridium magnum]|uniref:EamA-like transporter family protein n=1 Tax=Clostridium magnum DSM 2767 TaxID=1121326 RepID=A0A161WYA8_9CLOT|nr:DMT family transporter [Clostridium magnum]KZL92058.1 EamA-like transporter family protein [Clostridium magnum DSM 2767]SHH24170.1 Permease of the drug/metabolite transporter (DMT) superfamily [Clostridium magnum DSM 2767]